MGDMHHPLPSAALRKVQLSWLQQVARAGREKRVLGLLYWSIPYALCLTICVLMLSSPKYTDEVFKSDIGTTMYSIFMFGWILLMFTFGICLARQAMFWQAFPEYGFTRLWANFIDQLPHGTFMVSYSWGAPTSLSWARCIGTVFARSVCWLDVRELLPGNNIQDSCVAAVRNSKVQFVFLSPQYVKSPNCKAEFREIIKHPERAIVL